MKNRFINRTKNISAVAVALAMVCIIFVFYVYSTGISSNKNNLNYTKKDIRVEDLEEGDIIFWKVINQEDRAGHVAVVNLVNHANIDVRIVHSTDNPKYNAFVETHLPSSDKIIQLNKYYYVIRIKNPIIKRDFLKIIRSWLIFQIPFNREHEILMNEFDNSMARYTTKTKVKLQKVLFADTTPDFSFSIPVKGFMCSEIIIVALQKAFTLDGDISLLPESLKLDPILCPPSTMMLSLMHDQNNFYSLGALTILDAT